MAIQQINLGSAPSGAGGDTQRAANTKINQNFSNTTHAASRLVGTATGNLVEMTTDGMAGTGWGAKSPPQVASSQKLHLMSDTGVYKVVTSDIASTGAPPTAGDSMVVLNMPYATNYNVQMAVTRGVTAFTKMFFRSNPAGQEKVWQEVYHTGNTLKEEGTGHLYTSSPVILLRDGTMDKMHEAEDMDCELIKNGTGDYTLKNTTGLRDNEWHAVPPKDVHGNPLCMIVVTEPREGEVNIKTYKRKFDFELAAVVADLEQPFDIPSGSSVRLHFNDLPEEQLDEPIE